MINTCVTAKKALKRKNMKEEIHEIKREKLIVLYQLQLQLGQLE